MVPCPPRLCIRALAEEDQLFQEQEHAVVALQRGREPEAESPAIVHGMCEVIPATSAPSLLPVRAISGAPAQELAEYPSQLTFER